MKYCKYCGAQLDDDAAVCTKCGKALGEQPAQTQTVIIQQAAPTTVVVTQAPASPAEQNALFKSAGSFWMLIAAIVATVNLVSILVDDIFSLNIFGMLLIVLDILIVVGFWVTFANGRKQKLSAAGIKLIKVPYIIQYVFYVIRFALDLVGCILVFNVIGLLLGLITFIVETICFASVKKSLNVAQDIADNKSVAGRKAGKFAAIFMIISSVFSLVLELVKYFTGIGASPIEFIAKLLGSGVGIITIVSGVIALLVNISGAIVLLKFARKLKAAHEN